MTTITNWPQVTMDAKQKSDQAHYLQTTTTATKLKNCGKKRNTRTDSTHQRRVWAWPEWADTAGMWTQRQAPTSCSWWLDDKWDWYICNSIPTWCSLWFCKLPSPQSCTLHQFTFCFLSACRPAVSQLHSPPAPGQLHSPPAASQLHSPPAASKLRSPPTASQLHSPPAASQLQSPCA